MPASAAGISKINNSAKNKKQTYNSEAPEKDFNNCRGCNSIFYINLFFDIVVCEILVCGEL
jgi:hypothetical protein